MRIIDNRVSSRFIMAHEVLLQVLKKIPSRHTRGIKNLILLDSDYHEDGSALARYMEIEGTHAAEIELYIGDLLEYPKALQQNEFFLTWQLTLILMHEVYHHRVRGLHERKKPSDKDEEQKADLWARTEAHRIFTEIFPLSSLGKKSREAKEFLDKMEKGIFVWINE